MSSTWLPGVLFLLGFSGTAFAVIAVPEIDAGSAVSAIGLLAGVFALVGERWRRK